MFDKDRLFQPKDEFKQTAAEKIVADIILRQNSPRPNPFTQDVLRIPSTHEIAPVPPFYREKKPTVQVLGTENLVWSWNYRDLKGECTHRNCRSEVRFYAAKPLGHVFFFDIDEKVWENKVDAIRELRLVLFPFDVSHFILTETVKGFHLWILDIREHKTEWYSLFRTLKHNYESDYEFGGQWILRLGRKQKKPEPFFYGHAVNPDCKWKQISEAHLTLLNRYATMPKLVNYYINQTNCLVKTFARQVLYHSFDVHGVKIDEERF